MIGRRVELRTAAGAILFRVPHEFEIADYLDGLPLLGDPQASEGAARKPMSKAEIEQAYARADALLISCAMKPLLKAEPDPDAEGEIGVAELPVSQRMQIVKLLLERGNYKVEAVEEIRPT